ncbi:MAG: hypothetical protein IJS67_00845 [Clostridia bacterium]|nr:hypothetical protein [Clostridia bacterium]
MYTNDKNIDDWAQSCFEVYISEGFNRTKKKGDGDYTVRINAHGVYKVVNGNGNISGVKCEQTKEGYKAEFFLPIDLTKKDKIGFEIVAHDFDKSGKYKCSAYWNAVKGADVYNFPYHYGIMMKKTNTEG